MIEIRTLKEYEDLRKNVSFHFTPMQNLDNILENGLVSNFGDNSTGILGQSAIPKVYISYGLEGVMQLYNRILNLSQEGALEHFQGASHKPFIPKNLQGNDMNYKMISIDPSMVTDEDVIMHTNDNKDGVVVSMTYSSFMKNKCNFSQCKLESLSNN